MKVKKLLMLTSISLVTTGMLLTGCNNEDNSEEDNVNQSNESTNQGIDISKQELLDSESNGVYYEIFVRAFADSDDDGIGDLKGATEKLDYLKDLGVEGIWLMPMNPSPSYHGYDVTDYRDINPQYGTLDDMKEFIEEAHNRDIDVIMDLVLNHTSRKHPWFESALEGDSTYKDYYVWATEDSNKLALGEWGQQVWAKASNDEYYEALFWEGMPDLNYENPAVRDEMIDIGKFWLEEVGVDGFRLDAAKHIYSETSSEVDEPNDHKWWKEFRAEMESVDKDVILLGEVWDAATVVAPYLDNALTSTFNFDLAGKILESARSEKDAGVVTSLKKMRKYFDEVSSGSYTDSIFITNHDMDRVMSQLNEDTNQAKMAASILLTLPGRPFIYYGEETGMTGKKPDEEIRESFLWTKDENAPEQSQWRIPKYNTDFETKSVEALLDDENSILSHYKEMIHVRRSNEVLIEGEIDSSFTRENGLLTFKRLTDNNSMLIIHNLTGNDMEFDLSDKESDYTNVYYETKNDIDVTKKDGKVQVNMPSYSTLILTQP